MAAILAKKLGMTQVFQDDGSVARVTVLEAGPCPVTAVRTANRLGKRRRYRFRIGRLSNWKKAIVTLKVDSPGMDFF